MQQMLRLLRFVCATIVFGCILGAAISCQNTHSSNSPPAQYATAIPLSKDEWTKRWLNDIPCEAPCWEGIVPGQTSASEAVENLRRSPIIGTVKIERIQNPTNLGFVQWTWNDGTEGGSALFRTDTEDEVIDTISTALPAEYNLENIIKVFGEPTHVVATAGRGYEGGEVLRSLRIVFATHGFYLPVKSIPPALDNNLITLAPVFFVPSADNLPEKLGTASQFIVPWEGFQPFKFYCRDLDGGKACNSE